MSLFLSRLNRTLAVSGRTKTGTDGYGQPVYSVAAKGSVAGRVDPRVRPEEVNGPDLNPIISEYEAITALPSGFAIVERDTITDGSDVYEVLGVASMDGRVSAHHLELSLRKVAS